MTYVEAVGQDALECKSSLKRRLPLDKCTAGPVQGEITGYLSATGVPWKYRAGAPGKCTPGECPVGIL